MSPRLETRSATVIGSGPNGLTAAIRLAEAGFSVHLIEAEEKTGGGTRTEELTLPGFLHDVCSAVHPLGAASPVFRSMPLEKFGLEWIFPEIEAAHPFDGGKAATLHRSIEKTALGLGNDEKAYLRLIQPLMEPGLDLFADLMAPLHLPRFPVHFLEVGIAGVVPASVYDRISFKTPLARGMFAGMAAHGQQPLTRPVTAAYGLIIMLLGHLSGWPVARGGSARITDALLGYYCSLGGRVTRSHRVKSLDEIPEEDLVFLDVTPRQAIEIVGKRFPNVYRSRLERFRYGMGVFKMDFALDGPIPWAAEACSKAVSVHVGGSLEEIAASEQDAWYGRHNPRPYIILSQPALVDGSRAPQGFHTVWAYCHVPHGSTVDMSDVIEAQIERFAPGFRRRIIAKSTLNTRQMQAHNANYIGGDINGGVQDIFQFFTRPVLSLDPYRTPDPRIYFCSSSTPPGGGVHGLCGEYAVKSAFKNLHIA